MISACPPGHGATDIVSVPGINVPKSKIDGAGYTMLYYQNFGGDPWSSFPANYGHILQFGTNLPTCVDTYYPVLTPLQAYDVDSKIDDGCRQKERSSLPEDIIIAPLMI